MTIVEKSQAAQLEALMRNEPIDFIGVGYDIGNRFVEDKILPLADETVVLPGHGPATTIGRERATNPYLLQVAEAGTVS